MTEQTLSAFKRRRERRAQGLTEFALILPVLLFMIMGIIDFGRALFTYAQASSQLRQALRMASVVGYTNPVYLDCVGMRATAQNVFFAEPQITVTIEYAPAAKVTPSPLNYSVIYPASGNCTTTAASPFTESSLLINGDILKITEAVRVRMITPFFPQFLTFTISGQRTIVKDISLVNADFYDLGLSSAELTANADLYNAQVAANQAAAAWAAAQLAAAGNSATQTAIATWLAQTQTQNANTYGTSSAAIIGTYAANATALAASSTSWQTETAFAASVATNNAIANANNTGTAYIVNATSAFETAQALGVTLTPSTTPTATGTILYTDTPTPPPTATNTPTLGKVLNLVKWNTGSRCSGVSRYIGLSWSKLSTVGVQGYYIYANGVLVGKTLTTTNKIQRCGLTISKNVVGGTSGCFNLLPSAWVPATSTSYTVAAFSAGGAVVGAQSDPRVLTC